MTIIVPPGGFAGAAQMTPASQRALRLVNPTKSRTGKRARKRYARNARTLRGPKSKGPSKRRGSAKVNRRSKLVKGSAAAKAFMKRLRGLRKR